jgi:predicted RNase H-like HicB family nuclease
MERAFKVLIERDRNGYVALCPEYDIASQGETIEEARQNLTEALELFMECASPEELARRNPRAGEDASVGFSLRIFDQLGGTSE